jgi:tRNA threonylcarbamoyladenosine biosynthesis protein TsaB
MSIILNIETATEICSVSLSENGKLIALKEDHQGQNHAKLLTVFIDDLFKESNISIKKLAAVAISMGPGSYTGLRIGVSAAKGIAYAANIPLIAVNTLQALAYGVSRENLYGPESWICPMIDARRMEVYTAFFDCKNQIKMPVSAEIITENSFIDILKMRKVVFLGNGSAKCKESIQSENAVFLEDRYCTAGNMVDLSHHAFLESQFVDLAYFEPFYLKDFVATIPKNTILGNQ